MTVQVYRKDRTQGFIACPAKDPLAYCLLVSKQKLIRLRNCEIKVCSFMSHLKWHRAFDLMLIFNMKSRLFNQKRDFIFSFIMDTKTCRDIQLQVHIDSEGLCNASWLDHLHLLALVTN